MNKKGFTLIELLAVIILIGALSVLTIPKIVNTIKGSSKKIDSASASGLLKAAEYKASQKDINGATGDIIIDYDLNTNTDLLDHKGTKPEKGKVVIKENGQVNMAVKIGNFCYIKDKFSPEILEIPYNEETCVTSISFEKDSWKQIKEYLQKDRNFYEIGALKQIEIDVDGNGTIEDTEKFTVRLSNTSTPEKCETEGFSQTACGVVIEFMDEIVSSGLNSYNYPNAWSNQGGWPETEMYTYLNTTIYNKLPEDLKTQIIDTYTVSGYGESDSENIVSTDKLYLLSTGEVWNVDETGRSSGYLITEFDTAYYQTRQLDYYNKIGVKYVSSSDYCGVTYGYENYSACNNEEWLKEGEKTRKNVTNGTWWLRTARWGSSTYFRVDGSDPRTETAVSQFGITPAFRIL